MAEPVPSVRGLVKGFPVRRGGIFDRAIAYVHAVDDISLGRASRRLSLSGAAGGGRRSGAGKPRRPDDRSGYSRNEVQKRRVSGAVR